MPYTPEQLAAAVDSAFELGRAEQSEQAARDARLRLGVERLRDEWLGDILYTIGVSGAPSNEQLQAQHWAREFRQKLDALLDETTGPEK